MEPYGTVLKSMLSGTEPHGTVWKVSGTELYRIIHLGALQSAVLRKSQLWVEHGVLYNNKPGRKPQLHL